MRRAAAPARAVYEIMIVEATDDPLMPRQFFRSISPSRHSVIRQRWLRPLRHLLDHPDLWAIRRKSVSPAVAFGLFWMWMPIPAHSLAAGLTAIRLKINLPITMLMTAIINPLTIVPIYFSGYQVGRVILQLPERPFTIEFSRDWFFGELSAIWQPLFLGCLIMGVFTALAGYGLMEILWRTRAGQYLQRRRARRLAAAPKD